VSFDHVSRKRGRVSRFWLGKKGAKQGERSVGYRIQLDLIDKICLNATVGEGVEVKRAREGRKEDASP